MPSLEVGVILLFFLRIGIHCTDLLGLDDRAHSGLAGSNRAGTGAAAIIILIHTVDFRGDGLVGQRAALHPDDEGSLGSYRYAFR